MKRVLLVNMPFAALDSPSIALGLFKARLRQQGFHCDVEHLNFDFAELVGYDNYHYVLQLGAIIGGEQLFARSLFGSWLPSDHEYYQEILATKRAGADVPGRMELIRRFVPFFLESCFKRIDWGKYDIIGFTSLFEQNLSSLALARMVKERYPEKVIVFGGANCEDSMGLTMHRRFPFIDFVCSGEADESFPELVCRLEYNHPVSGLLGVVHRQNGRTEFAGPARMFRDLDSLPIPNYDEYFARLEQSPLRQSVRPSLLIESGRGCWWGEKSHCTFCGLNGLTMEFRTKRVERTVEEIAQLTNRYSSEIVRFVDNILGPNYFRDLLPELTRRQLRANYICEVKSNLKKNQIQVLADAGVTVQAGIENLSTSVLDLMGKGSNSLMNIQTLKWCKQLGVLADWNLIHGFPGEGPEDYRRNLELASMLSHLDPPAGCGPIRLDRFSPNFNRSDEKGLTNVRPMKFYKYIYPFDDDTLADLVYYFDFDYKQPIDNGGHLAALEDAVHRWKQHRDQMYCQRLDDKLIIRDTRPVASWPETEVTGIAATVYEFCDKTQSFAKIVELVTEALGDTMTEEQISGLLDELVARKLMAKEGNRYLSLAVIPYAHQFEDRAGDPKQKAAASLEETVARPAAVGSPALV